MYAVSYTHLTQDKAGKILPVIIAYYADKSFDFVIKTPPVAIQLLEVAKVTSGSAEPNRKKVAELTWEQEMCIRDSITILGAPILNIRLSFGW